MTSSPYVSDTYSFTSANTTAPSLTVTVVDGAGNQTTETPAFVRDTTAPTGMSATVTGGWVTAASVPVTLDSGADPGAGVDAASGIVERDATTLAGGTCGSFTGSWTPVTLAGAADTGVQSGHCYRYRYSVADRVGNRGTQAGASATVMVDTDGSA